jgi:hypothetical protein
MRDATIKRRPARSPAPRSAEATRGRLERQLRMNHPTTNAGKLASVHRRRLLRSDSHRDAGFANCCLQS